MEFATGRFLPIPRLCHMCLRCWVTWAAGSHAHAAALASFACSQTWASRERAAPAREDLCGAPGCDLHTCPCTHNHGHMHMRPAPGPAHTGSRFLPEAAAAGGISDLLMKRSDCAAGACQAEMSARGDWITLWPVSLRSLQTAAAPRSTISFSSCCLLPPWARPAATKGRGGMQGHPCSTPWWQLLRERTGP